MGLVHKISERPSGALVATGVTCAPGVNLLICYHRVDKISLENLHSNNTWTPTFKNIVCCWCHLFDLSRLTIQVKKCYKNKCASPASYIFFCILGLVPTSHMLQHNADKCFLKSQQLPGQLQYSGGRRQHEHDHSDMHELKVFSSGDLEKKMKQQ